MIGLALATVLVAAAPTAKIVFSPFHGSLLARTVVVERNVRGSCSGGSEVSPRWDAWQCKGGGRTYDPCFSGRLDGVGAPVICMSSPWAGATKLELTRKLPQALANVVGDPRTHAPWALELADGTRCVHLLGQLQYRCGGVPTGGRPVRGGPVWRLGDAAIARAYW
jgi:hypothetical protein